MDLKTVTNFALVLTTSVVALCGLTGCNTISTTTKKGLFVYLSG